MDKKHRYSAGMLAAALIVGIGIGFCGGFAVGGHTGSRQQNTTEGGRMASMPCAFLCQCVVCEKECA